MDVTREDTHVESLRSLNYRKTRRALVTTSVGYLLGIGERKDLPTKTLHRVFQDGKGRNDLMKGQDVRTRESKVRVYSVVVHSETESETKTPWVRFYPS